MSSEAQIEIARREIRAAGPREDAAALRTAYLDLLKLCLCDLAGAGTRTISWTGDRRVFSRDLTGDDQMQWRAAGRDWPLNAITMTGLVRLDALQDCVETIVGDQVPGDLIEAGAWRGGSSILMRATLDSLGADDRTVWLADSFQGFPLPEDDGVAEDRELELDMRGLDYLAPSLEQVRGYFARFGCDRGVDFIPGFFEDTMRGLGPRRWSVVRLDGDTYKATRLTLEALYPQLAVGGYVVLDDYHFLESCRRAVDDFRREHAITEPIERIDFNGARWRRESDAPIAAQPDDGAGVTSPAPAPRQAAGQQRGVPTDRELQLGDELAQLRAQLQAAQAEIATLRASPLLSLSTRLQKGRRRS